MRKHIIVEGMDGSGKTTLLGQLKQLFPNHTPHARASTSLGGPVANLAEWVVNDANSMPTDVPGVYDRHPLVSEPIYGPIRPDRPTEETFTNPAWLSAYRRIVARESVLVICQPPFHIVKATLDHQGAEAHMPGVYDNALTLYTKYSTLVWPGRTIRYNYMADELSSLVALLRQFVTEG